MTNAKRRAWKPVTREQPCEACGKGDWCRRSSDGTRVACRRESRGAIKTKRYKDGSEAYIHVVQDSGKASDNGKPKRRRKSSGFTPTSSDTPTRQDSPTSTGDGQDTVAKRDAGYRRVLDLLPLSPDHRDSLRQRGLSDADIDAGRYRTLPANGRAVIVKTLAAELGQDFAAVPGFVMSDGRPRIAAPSGLLIPVRDLAGRIVALKVRVDNPKPDAVKYLYLSSAKYGGPSPGSPVHIPLRGGRTTTTTNGVASLAPNVTTVRITEGELKADVATVLSGILTISFPGVSSWRAVLPVLQALGVKAVRVAFDADAPNKKEVARCLRDCFQELQNLNYTVELERWPIEQGKGIDDFLAAEGQPEVLAGEAALAAVKDITLAAGVAPTGPGETSDAPDCPYFADDIGTYWMKGQGDNSYPVQLANFSARIVGEVVQDDGAEQNHLLELEAVYRGRKAQFTETATRFAIMNWPIERLGATAIVQPGQGTRDRLRVAIQTLSGDVRRQHVYCHLGWRRVDGRWVYLHAGGAIGPVGPVAGLEGDLPESLRRYVLPVPPIGDELANAVRASLRLLDLGPDPVMCSLLGAVWRSVLGPADFSMFLVGATGVGKSERGALAQQHFGPEMRNKQLPANWSSTANSLEALAFLAKDAILTVDDFAPSGSAADVARYHREAERLLRAQGNRSGRGRQRPDATLRPDRPPRGLILCTGEDVPRGHSVRGRTFILELERGRDDCLERLTPYQQDAASGLYAAAMAGFLRWLAVRYEDIQAEMPRRVTELRSQAYRESAHPRTPEIVANLAYGWEVFLRFALAEQILSAVECEAIWEQAWKALNAASDAQASHHANADPVPRFGELLSSAIASGSAHVAGPDGNAPDTPEAWGWRQRMVGTGGNERTEWQPCGDRVGWFEDGQLYLDGDAAYRVAQKQAGNGETIPVAYRTLFKRLRERNLLATWEEPRLTVRRWLEGSRRHVHHVHHERLMSHKVGQVGQSDQDAAMVEDSGPLSWPTSARDPQELGQRSGPADAEDGGESVALGSVGPLGPVPETYTQKDDWGEI